MIFIDLSCNLVHTYFNYMYPKLSLIIKLSSMTVFGVKKKIIGKHNEESLLMSVQL